MTKSKPKIGVLYSGGLDSAALIGMYVRRGFQIFPVYVQSGLRWEQGEIRRAQNFLRHIDSRNVKPLTFAHLNLEHAYRNNWSQAGRTPRRYSDDRQVFLPGRNLLLTTQALLALSSEGIFELALATLKGNPFSDASSAYFRKLEEVFSEGFGRRVRIHTPFLNRGKADVIRSAKGFPIHLSLSCINPQRNLHCGNCNKCAERQRAFRRAGVTDETRYAKARRVKRSS